MQTGRSPDELRETLGDYDDMFVRLLADSGFEFTTYAVLDGEFPESTGDADGWLITGSRFGVYEDHSWIPPLESFLRSAYRESVPIVGICFGHQILAQALGGKVEKSDAGWSVGVVDYAIDGFESTLPLVAWHQDQVVVPPPEARTIGSSDSCPHAVLVYGDRALTIQPHPEFNTEFVAGLFAARRHLLPADRAESGLRSLDREVASTPIAETIAAFFRLQRDSRN